MASARNTALCERGAAAADELVANAATGIVALTKSDPQTIFISCAAGTYRADTGCVVFAAVAWKMAMVFCKQVSQVGLVPPGKEVFNGR